MRARGQELGGPPKCRSAQTLYTQRPRLCVPKGKVKGKEVDHRKRWDDDIREVAGAMWNRVPQDRSEWKRLEEAFADWQTDL
ncbi:hypothetical protein EVAR_27365_1 [Eumeta japonica]|uniref:Uncharacterized protein n=1 Tax=Eumeta variegata TaxID=151549 RepID=A0A4C1X4W4_EUMVA|nr:hypothetical protein EVAR_27365_1 [Eumeta japonica]